MPRPRKDGTPAQPPRRQTLTAFLVEKIKPEMGAFSVWDEKQKGLVLRVQPSGQRSYTFYYPRHGRARWYHIGDVRSVGLGDARKLAAKVMLQVIAGTDPVAERQAARGSGTFAELHSAYLAHAKKVNKSWRQADALVRRHLLPRWGNLSAREISRADVRAVMARIEAPIVANQTLAAASAIFTWGANQEMVAANPCRGVDRNATTSRERVLSASELKKFWHAFDGTGLIRGSALKTILLTGQRPGEVSHMRLEHIADGWWEMPGAPDPSLDWPGTKNGESHRVWLPQPVQQIVAEVTDDAKNGFVFSFTRGKPVGNLGAAMKKICVGLGVADRVTPHDLRRTHGTTIASLGFGRDMMNRIQNHKDGGIASVYDRHGYAKEIQHVMEATASHILALAEDRATESNVVSLARDVA